MSAANAAETFADIFKERMMNMPKEFNTKKEIDEYSKKITKEIKEEAKNKKLEIAEKKRNDKKKKRENLDDEGNEKPKKALTKYQQYIKDNQQRIRDEFPDISNTERFAKLAEQWNAYKATLEDPGNAKDVEDAEDAKDVEDEEDAKDVEDAEDAKDAVDVKTQDVDEKPNKPSKVAKKEKAPKKDKKPKQDAK
jgi:hypothetical protein